MKWTTNRQRLHVLASGLVALVVTIVGLGLYPANVWAACNLIPGTEKTFDATLGATNRPFAGPGEPIELRVRPCDAPVSQLTAVPADHIVTVIFTPTAGPKHAKVLTAGSCSALGSQLTSCAASLGGGTATCVEGSTAGVQIVDRNSQRYLRFLFPDSDAQVDGASDDRTLSGPATIAVTPASALSLPCQLATNPCIGQAGLIACIDEFFVGDGTCRRSAAHGTFNHFTALPQANDFQAACWTEPAVCTQAASEFRATTDIDGNVLIPMDWRGILVRQDNVPVPRLLRTTLSPPIPVTIPGRSFVASYTPEGGILPPIFEPQFDPQAPSGDITLFGSADAPYTILRMARRSAVFMQCAGGAYAGLPCNEAADCPAACTAGMNAGQRCSSDADCPSSTCGAAGACGAAVCYGGARTGLACNSDNNCPSGTCGPTLFDVESLAAGGGSGPLLLTRFGNGICQEDTYDVCSTMDVCSSGPCVQYALEANNPVPLEGLTGSSDLFAFVVSEGIDGQDRNGDSDSLDSVVTLRDRETGAAQALGAPASCGISGTPEGRAAIRVQQPPFSFPAIASEGEVVAFLESEAAQKSCDINGDGDRADAVLRVFELGGGESSGALTPARAIDAALRIDGRSLAISNGQVFYRRPEADQADRITQRANVSTAGVQGNAAAFRPTVSADGRYVAFASPASNLVMGDSNNPGAADVFVRDTVTNTTELISLSSGGLQGGDGGDAPSLSADGRYVAFVSTSVNLVPGDTNTCGGFVFAGQCPDVFVRDRVANTTVRVSVASGGVQTSGGSSGALYPFPAISADGRFVVFASDATNVVAGDMNGQPDVFVHDRQMNMTERVSVGPSGVEGNGSSGNGALGISVDGRYVVFDSTASNLVAGDGNGTGDVFVHDRQMATTERVSVTTGGTEVVNGGNSPSISSDGRIVAFSTNAVFVPADTNSTTDIYTHDRDTGITARVSIGTGGVHGNAAASNVPSLSADGRFVVFASFATNLVAGDTNAAKDIFVHDRLTTTTQRVSVTTDGTEANDDCSISTPVISADGRFIVFDSFESTNLVTPDTNADSDIILRGPDLMDGGSDTFANGSLTDTVLEVLDVGSATATPLCPATEVSVASGKAVFLRPESALGTAACPAGSLNGDLDTDDEVVQLWPGSGAVQNLGVAATAVRMSDTVVAALVSEEAHGGAFLNGDGDALDSVLEVRPVGGGAWTSVGVAADSLQVSGSIVAVLVPESEQGGNLNGSADGDQNDRVLHVYDAISGQLTNTKQAAEDLVVGTENATCGSSPIVAFRTSEAAQANTDLNDDGDSDDDVEVLQIYVRGLGVINTHHAVIPCRLEACDPRQPYRVSGDKVRFLTFEPDQEQDLNGDNDSSDLVLQVYDVCPRTVTTIGVVEEDTGSVGDPLIEPEQADAAVLVVQGGRCVQGLTLLTVPASCATTADCPSGATCQADFIVSAPVLVPTHDTVLRAPKPLSFTIPAGVAQVDKTITVKVTNADVSPVKEKPGHAIRVSVADGTCPVGTVQGLADFDGATAGDQDSIVAKGAQTKAAKVRIRLTDIAFPTHSPKAPRRCRLFVEAQTTVLDNEDPTPGNNRAEVEINITDRNDSPLTSTHESTIKSVPPVKVTLGETATSAVKTVKVQLGNADLADIAGHSITVVVSDGDCPAGTVTVDGTSTFAVNAGGKSTAKLAVMVTPAGFTSRSSRALGRCTATVTATTDVMGNSEPDTTNNSTNLLIDVLDKSDF